MEAVVITALIGACICGGMLVEAFAPLLPALLGLEGTPDRSVDRSATSVTDTGAGAGSLPRQWVSGEASDDPTSALLELERRVQELEAERDFYRSLAERPAPGARRSRGAGPS